MTCIFLNKTNGNWARAFLDAFLKKYPTAESLRYEDPARIKSDYFYRLGLYRRAWWLVTMANQLIMDPPRPNVLRQKLYRNAGYACEVAHLAGVGNYACDAWRLFCKRSFYAEHEFTVLDEWRVLQPGDPHLRRYVMHKRQQERQAMAIVLDTETLALRLMALRLADDFVASRKVVVRSKDSALHVPDRIVHRAIVASIVGSGTGSMLVTG